MSWTRLEDGMDDPGAHMVGGIELTTRRRAAMTALLDLMGCHDRKGYDCEHIAAIRELVDAATVTAFLTFEAGIADLPRPLSMRDIHGLIAKMSIVTMLPPSGERRP